MPPIISRPTRKGETIVEVMFAVAIFGAVAIVAIQMMNRGSLTAQVAVEAQQARNEMDAQVSAIKFIHDGFLAEREYPASVRQFETLWDSLTASPRSSAPLYHPPDDSCAFAINDANASQGAFIINTRALQPNATGVVRRGPGVIEVAPVYPRVLYVGADATLTESTVFTNFHIAQGLQVFAVASGKKINGQPEYYDFHVRACWRAAGQSTDSKLSTITRALNPKAIE